MGSESWRQGASVEAELLERPGRFDFFQAVRLLERLAGLRHGENGKGARQPIGNDRPPANEFVHFAASATLRFPATLIRKLRWRNKTEALAEATVTFMGLTGPSGVLPDHYTEMLISRRRLRDRTLGAFLDLFNHRLISFFYRAWEKYRAPFCWERSQRAPGVDDPFAQALMALAGMGMAPPQHRTDIADELFMRYAGYFARPSRSAHMLEGLLRGYLEVPVAVRQFIGRWRTLETEDRSRLPSALQPHGQHCGLGFGAMLGEAVLDVQAGFRVQVGPVSYRQFTDLSPTRPALKRLMQLIRLAVGPEYDFDIQILLRGEDIPPSALTTDEDRALRLGQNAWIGDLRSRAEIGDAIYETSAS